MTFSRPNHVTEIDELPINNKTIKALEIVEIALIAIMVIDFLGKVMNYTTVCKANQIQTENNKENQLFYLDEHLVFDPIKLNNGEFLIQSSMLVMDAIMIATIITCFIIQTVIQNSDKVTYLQVGVLVITRAYLKLPFSIMLISFRSNVQKIKLHLNQVMPKSESKLEFKTYKEKVLFILS